VDRLGSEVNGFINRHDFMIAARVIASDTHPLARGGTDLIGRDR